MADFGVTEQGFRRKTYPQIIAAMEARAQDLFGSSVDLSSASPLAIFMRVIAFGLALLWSVSERVYGSAFIDFAGGQSLDWAVKYAGVSRRPPAPAYRVLRFSGDSGTQVPEGFLVETESGSVRFATLEAVVMGLEGTAEVLARAETPGTVGNVAPGQLVEATNPEPGIDAVTNIASERNLDGLDRETDRELRERYYLSLARGGASTIDSIRASVLEVPGVRTTRVFENVTMAPDSDGRPPKSVEVVTLGGVDMDVARAILDTLAAGIQPYGEIRVEVEDSGGQLQEIWFSRASVVDVYVTAQVSADARYPADGDARVQEAIISYVGGLDAAGVDHPGLDLGQAVVWTALIEAARSVPGVVDVDVTLGFSPSPTGRSNLPMGAREVGEASFLSVVVSHV